MTQRTHNCRFCGGLRDNNGKSCSGCGSDLVACTQTKEITKRVTCPACKLNGLSVEMEPGRFRCQHCRSVFETDDMGFLDDRPDINLDKKEWLKHLERQHRQHNHEHANRHRRSRR